jgi:hypothetical protein
MDQRGEQMPSSLDLVRDVLDEQVVDRDGRAVGKVDSVIFELRDDGPPKVTGMEIGTVAAARRVHPVLGRWVLRLMRRFGVGNGDVLRVPLQHVTKQGVNLRVEVDAEKTPAYAWERWLRQTIRWIPGAGG